MKRIAVILASLFLALGCREKEAVPQSYPPAIRVELTYFDAFKIKFTVSTIGASSVLYGVGVTENEAMALAKEAATPSTLAEKLELSWNGLLPLTEYILCVKGVGPGGETDRWESIPFKTANGPDGLYDWERERNGAPSFADISLVTLGRHNSNPPEWTPERFGSHVAFDGKWLFDAFLLIDGWDPARNLSYSITPNRYSATQESWQDLLDAWLGPDGAILKLEEAVARAEKAIGPPPSKRYVVMGVPDPIMFQYFGDKNSSTTYWGSIDGRELDFRAVSDQIAAYQWYIDRCRYMFDALDVPHLELAGFYTLSEELHLAESFYKWMGISYSSADTWNAQYKRWEEILPAVSSYLHSCNEGLWWVPYCLAPGYKVWDALGFDMAFMQPNHYWDTSNQHPMSKTIQAMKQYGMGIELEFEYSMVADVMKDGRMGPDGSGNMIFTAADIPALRGRLREYMASYKDAGLYGRFPIAVYSGTDAWNQLATSSDSNDKEMFREICNFITQSPLKR